MYLKQWHKVCSTVYVFCDSVSSTVHYDFFVSAEQTLNKPIVCFCVYVCGSKFRCLFFGALKSKHKKSAAKECQNGMSSAFLNWHESNSESIEVEALFAYVRLCY